jgi:hypothetical protein
MECGQLSLASRLIAARSPRFTGSIFVRYVISLPTKAGESAAAGSYMGRYRQSRWGAGEDTGGPLLIGIQ